ncbi:sporulation-induced protein [Sorochytrium milnesiophthora]
MFWRFGFQTASAIDGLLDKSDLTLEELLDEVELLQECKTKNQKLPDIVAKLLDYVSKLHLVPLEAQATSPTEAAATSESDMPASAASTNEGENAQGNSQGEEELSPAALAALRNEKLLIKCAQAFAEFCPSKLTHHALRYPYLVTEIFAADMMPVYDTMLNDPSIFTSFAMCLFGHSTPVHPVQATYWSKIICSLLIKKTRETLVLLKQQDHFIPNLIHLSVDSPSLMDLLLKFVGVEELPDGRAEQSIQWLASQNFIAMLVEYLHPKYSAEARIHSNVSSALLDVIAMIQALSMDGARMEDSPLIKSVKSEATTRQLLEFMLDTKTGNVASTLVNGISIFVELIRRNSAELEEAYQRRLTEGGHASMGGEENPLRLPMDLSEMIRMLCLYLPDFQQRLTQAPPSSRQIESTIGKLAPLGQDRLRVCELIAELLRCAIDDSLLDCCGSALESFPSMQKDTPPATSAADSDAASNASTQQSSKQPAGRSSIESHEHEAAEGKISPTRSMESGAVSFASEMTSSIRPKVNIASHTLLSREKRYEMLQRVVGPSLQQALRDMFVDTKIIVTCTELFFSFPWNNLLHGIVYDILLQVLNGQYPKCKSLILTVLQDGQLTKKLTRAQRLSDYHSELPRGVRLGYMGHVTLIAEEIVKILEREPDLQSELTDLLRLDDWLEFSTKTLRETLERDRKPLGGGKPPPSLGGIATGGTSGASAVGMDDDDDVVDVALGNVATDQFARYLCQQITSDLPDKFGTSEDNDDDDDDEDADAAEWNAFGSLIRSPFNDGPGSDMGTSVLPSPIALHQPELPLAGGDNDEAQSDVQVFVPKSTGESSILSSDAWTADFKSAFGADDFDMFGSEASGIQISTSHSTLAADPADMLFQSPLVSSTPCSSAYQHSNLRDVQVPTFITHPLVESSRTKVRLSALSALKQLSTLELVLLKASQNTSDANTAKKLAEVQQTAEQFFVNNGRWLKCKNAANFLQRSGLSSAYPLCAARYESADASSDAATASGDGTGSVKTDVKAYLHSMTVLNQVVTLALQLRHDMTLTNHKYIAHQIALLYQSLNSTRSELKSFKSKIETQFDAIKAACSAQVPDPQLGEEQQKWLTDLTTEVLTQALFKDNMLTPQAAKIIAYFQSL